MSDAPQRRAGARATTRRAVTRRMTTNGDGAGEEPTATMPFDAAAPPARRRRAGSNGDRPAERLSRVPADRAELLPRVDEGRDETVERPRVQPRAEGERAHVPELGGDGLDHRLVRGPADRRPNAAAEATSDGWISFLP